MMISLMISLMHRRRNVTKSGWANVTLMSLCGKHNPPRKVFSAFLNYSRRGESIAIFNFHFGVQMKILGYNFGRKVGVHCHWPTRPLPFLRLWSDD